MLHAGRWNFQEMGGSYWGLDAEKRKLSPAILAALLDPWGDAVSGKGFVPVRRGILDHCQRGAMPLLGFAIYMHLLLEADSSSGFVWSSAPALAAKYGYKTRSAQDMLAELEAAGYIRRFCAPGRTGNFPIGINK